MADHGHDIATSCHLVVGVEQAEIHVHPLSCWLVSPTHHAAPAVNSRDHDDQHAADGPGLGDTVGLAGTYAPLPDTAKWTLSFKILFGRPGSFSILILLCKTP
jgi:hypothetical protein